MTQTHRALPEPQAISQAWLSFKDVVGVTWVRTEEDYEQASAIVNFLLGIVRDNEDHPLADVLHYLGDQMERYEDEHFPIPEAKPSEMLRFFMEEHGLKQEDLVDCAPQSRISDILNGKRSISKEIAKKLARRFHVHADLFL
jgi:HTH-type transcriptional regulator/antitoxin HigA